MAENGAERIPSTASKRAATANQPETAVKKRAPYASRACDACKRRKGRCDGQERCEYCSSRGWECSYTVGATEARRAAIVSDAEGPLQSGSSAMPQLSDLSGFLASMQGQLNTLAAIVHSASDKDHIPQQPRSNGSNARETASTTSQEYSIDITSETSSKPKSPRRKPQRYLGPTSPAYSLHAAKKTLKAGSPTSSLQSTTWPPATESFVSDEETSDESSEDRNRQLDPPTATQASLRKLLKFRYTHSSRDTNRLLAVYHHVIGDFHPVVSSESLSRSADRCYATSSSPDRITESEKDQYDATVLNLALAIALCAEPGSGPRLAAAIMNDCREIVSVNLVYLEPSVNSMVIALMTAFYHFFRDNLAGAWRLCGVAGRIAMELGLHTAEAVNLSRSRGLNVDEVANNLASIIVLDRQWSASAGLPTHFNNSSFDRSLVYSATNPYLSAMLVFCQISDKFAEPISQAAKGGVCEDDETFEICNFQIEQWRKKTLSGDGFTHPRELGPNSPEPTPWKILLYLRANAVRMLLLRPFFLPSATVDVGKRNIQPGLDLISESIDCLDWLDRNTEIYRRLHPSFQHLLNSSCALLSLMVAFVGQYRSDIPPETVANVSQCVNRAFSKASRLATQYSSVSRFSNQLRKYLASVENSFRQQGFLPQATTPGTAHINISVVPNTAQPLAERHDQHRGRPSGNALAAVHQFFPPPFQGLDMASQATYDAPMSGFASNPWLAANTTNHNNGDSSRIGFGSPSLLDFGWPLDDSGGFF